VQPVAGLAGRRADSWGLTQHQGRLLRRRETLGRCDDVDRTAAEHVQGRAQPVIPRRDQVLDGRERRPKCLEPLAGEQEQHCDRRLERPARDAAELVARQQRQDGVRRSAERC
jgi:hypothetical protein